MTAKQQPEQPVQPQYAPQPDPNAQYGPAPDGVQFAQAAPQYVPVQQLQTGLSGWLLVFVILMSADALMLFMAPMAYSMGVEFASVGGIFLLIFALISTGINVTAIVLVAMQKWLGKVFGMIAAAVHAVAASLFWVLMIPPMLKELNDEMLVKAQTTYGYDAVIGIATDENEALIMQIALVVSMVAYAVVQILYFALSKRVKYTLVK